MPSVGKRERLNAPARVRRRLYLTGMTASLALACGASTVASGVTIAHADQPVTSLYERRTRHLVLQRWDISCGAAALATVLKFQHGEHVTERDIALRMMGRDEYLDRPELVRLRHGFSLLDMQRVAEGYGYRATGLGALQLNDLEEHAPAIVPVDINGYRHFLVFLGRSGSRVVLADPAYGRRTMRVDAFEESWIDYPEVGRVGLIVARRDGLIPPNKLYPRPDDFQFVN